MKRLKKALIWAACAVTLGVNLVFPAVGQAAKASAYDDFFANSVFLGDSITVGLEEYVDKLRSSDSKAFSNAQFLAKNSYSIRASLQDDGASAHPYWKGEQKQPQKSIAKMGVSKVFILMGINDIKEDMDDTISYYKTLIGRIKDANPGVSVYVQSVFPMTARREASNMSNSRIDSFNGKLKSMCSKLSVTYIDISAYFKDSNGRLKSSYSGDDYVHLSSDGYAVWVKALREYAAGKSAGGTIINVTSSLNLRSSPSTSAKVVTKLRNSTSIVIEDAFVDYEWHKVSVDGKTGYIHRDFVHIDNVNYVSGTIIKVNEFVNARSKPNASSDVVRTIKKGESVQVVLSYSTSNWYLVYYKNQYMYVRNDFISFG